MDTRQKVVGAFALGSGITSCMTVIMLKKQNKTIRKLNHNGWYMYGIIKKILPYVPTDVLEELKTNAEFEAIVDQLRAEDGK